MDKKENFFTQNRSFVEQMYECYVKDVNNVSDEWRAFFDSISHSSENYSGTPTIKKFEKIDDSEICLYSEFIRLKCEFIVNMIADSAYINFDSNPLQNPKNHVSYFKNYLSLSDAEGKEIIDARGRFGFDRVSASEFINAALNCYSDSIGCEMHYIVDPDQKSWLRDFMENKRSSIVLSKPEEVLQSLVEAAEFERFLHLKFPGMKRFSAEGSESFSLILDEILRRAAKNSLEKAVLGMAHRGRLSSLWRITGKPLSLIMASFKENGRPDLESGAAWDVKYHFGYDGTKHFEENQIDVSMLNNPSHLESVNPVAAGSLKAIRDSTGDKNGDKNFLILIHGDAAIAGQGIVYESMTIGGVDGYENKGVIHIVINNQIGYTATSEESRCFDEPTGIASAFNAPVFHVNADSPDSVAEVAAAAFDYRSKFKRDVFINLIGYRKYGHNEGDEPRFTQPLMYSKIDSKEPVDYLYAKQKNLDIESIRDVTVKSLQKGFEESANFPRFLTGKACNQWNDKIVFNYSEDIEDRIKGVREEDLKRFLISISSFPENFSANSKLKKLVQSRIEIAQDSKPFNWGVAELLSFASILDEECSIRLSGQDSVRGTFAHRHAFAIDEKNEAKYSFLDSICKNGVSFSAYNSPLSEYGVMGFDYGYSISRKDVLVLWEGQFGDFANGAQIIIDQYLSSAEVKWLQSSNLTLLLPHAAEGQGPEHTSARIERFLQLCASFNMRVMNCSTPANYFHALRRQAFGKIRKPAIIFTPKSLLRNKNAVSNFEDINENSEFLEIIDDPLVGKASSVFIFCSGKIYYDLQEARSNLDNCSHIRIVRIEQLYPLAEDKIMNLANISNMRKAKKIIWCQEEPKNMGAWFFINEHLRSILLRIDSALNIEYIGRDACASPAEGCMSDYVDIQKKIINDALHVD